MGVQGRLQDKYLTVQVVHEKTLFSPRAGLKAATAGAKYNLKVSCVAHNTGNNIYKRNN